MKVEFAVLLLLVAATVSSAAVTSCPSGHRLRPARVTADQDRELLFAVNTGLSSKTLLTDESDDTSTAKSKKSAKSDKSTKSSKSAKTAKSAKPAKSLISSSSKEQAATTQSETPVATTQAPPTSTPSSWFAMAGGSGNCAPGLTIVSASNCALAGAVFGFRFLSEVTTASGRPAGCFWDQNTRSYFNTNFTAVPDKWGGIGALCWVSVQPTQQLPLEQTTQAPPAQSTASTVSIAPTSSSTIQSPPSCGSGQERHWCTAKNHIAQSWCDQVCAPGAESCDYWLPMEPAQATICYPCCKAGTTTATTAVPKSTLAPIITTITTTSEPTTQALVTTKIAATTRVPVQTTPESTTSAPTTPQVPVITATSTPTTQTHTTTQVPVSITTSPEPTTNSVIQTTQGSVQTSSAVQQTTQGPNPTTAQAAPATTLPNVQTTNDPAAQTTNDPAAQTTNPASSSTPDLVVDTECVAIVFCSRRASNSTWSDEQCDQSCVDLGNCPEAFCERCSSKTTDQPEQTDSQLMRLTIGISFVSRTVSKDRIGQAVAQGVETFTRAQLAQSVSVKFVAWHLAKMTDDQSKQRRLLAEAPIVDAELLVSVPIQRDVSAQDIIDRIETNVKQDDFEQSIKEAVRVADPHVAKSLQLAPSQVRKANSDDNSSSSSSSSTGVRGHFLIIIGTVTVWFFLIVLLAVRCKRMRTRTQRRARVQPLRQTKLQYETSPEFRPQVAFGAWPAKTVRLEMHLPQNLNSVTVSQTNRKIQALRKYKSLSTINEESNLSPRATHSDVRIALVRHFDALLAVAHQQLCPEIVLCWRQAERFARHPSRKLYLQIKSEFLIPGAPHVVNLDNSLVRALPETYNTEKCLNCIHECQMVVERLILLNLLMSLFEQRPDIADSISHQVNQTKQPQSFRLAASGTSQSHPTEPPPAGECFTARNVPSRLSCSHYAHVKFNSTDNQAED